MCTCACQAGDGAAKDVLIKGVLGIDEFPNVGKTLQGLAERADAGEEKQATTSNAVEELKAAMDKQVADIKEKMSDLVRGPAVALAHRHSATRSWPPAACR